MNTFNLIRFETSDQGTFGKLYRGTEDLGIYTGELPDKGNEKNVSCIPKGEYAVTPSLFKSTSAWRVHNVPNRSGILIHIGNYCGDYPEYSTDVRGCILLGHNFGTLSNQKAILGSRSAIEEFDNITLNNGLRSTFILNIFSSGE